MGTGGRVLYAQICIGDASLWHLPRKKSLEEGCLKEACLKEGCLEEGVLKEGFSEAQVARELCSDLYFRCSLCKRAV